MSYALSPTDNSAAAIAAAINSQYADKVRATIVNVGSSAQSDFRISLQATKLGDLKPGLLIGPAGPTSNRPSKPLAPIPWPPAGRRKRGTPLPGSHSNFP